MKTAHYVSSVLTLGLMLILAPAVFSNETHKEGVSSAKPAKGELVPADSVSSEWLAKAKASYPTTTCIVSGDKLEGGDMGTPQDFVYRVKGQPDRLVRFCCKDCIEDFSKDPEKYIGKLRETGESKSEGNKAHH